MFNLKSEKIKRISKNFLPVFSILVVLVLLAFAGSSHDKQRCTKVTINIKDREFYQFISKKDVLNIITNREKDPLERRKLSSIELRAIESKLVNSSFVKEAQAYFNIKGELTVELTQRVPVLRVLNSQNENYYLDTEGKRMPLSNHFTAKVPLATAEYLLQENDSIKDVLNKKLYYLASYLSGDKYAKALSGQIIFDESHEFTVIPRLGNFEIFLGDTSDLSNKFVRLKSFYKSSLPQDGWNAYNRINLKYKNQIIVNHKE